MSLCTINIQLPPLPHLPFVSSNQLSGPVPSCQLISLTQTVQPRMQELCYQTRNVFVLFFNFLPEFLSSNKSTVSQIQSKWPFPIFLFLFIHCLNKNHWHILKEKLKVGVCTWTDSFGISQTRFIHQTSVDPLTHFLISSSYLWNFFHSLMEVCLWLFCKAFGWGEMDRQMQQLPLLHSKLSKSA